MCRKFRQTDLGENFIRLQCSLHHIHKEVISLYGTHPIWPFRHNIGLQCQYHSRSICGRVRVCNTSADSTPVAYLLIANQIYSLWQQGKMLLDKIRSLDIHISCHRAYGNRITIVANIRQFANLTKIN